MHGVSTRAARHQVAGGWWRVCGGAQPYRGRSRHVWISHRWLALSFECACLPFVVAGAKLRVAGVELLQPRKLLSDISSKTCEGG